MTASGWSELKFQFNYTSFNLADGADLSEYEMKLYTQCADVTVSYFADYAYVADRSGIFLTIVPYK